MKIKKIDTSKWQPYDLNKLFHIVLPKGDIQEKKIDDGDIPLISAGKINNGIVKYVDKNGDGISTIIDGNCITIDMFGKSFYQEQSFYAVSHGRVNILVPKFELNKNIALFLCSVLDGYGNKYNFKEMCNKARLEKLKITIPINKNNEPDFNKMEEYNKTNTNKIEEKIKQCDLMTLKQKKKIDTSTWKEFDLKDLFEIEGTGKEQTTISQDGSINLVSSTGVNNGVAKCISNGNKLFSENKITLAKNGCVGKCFYQKDNFYATSDVFILKSEKLNQNIALFIIPIIESVCFNNFSWNDKINNDKFNQLKTKLPTTPDNQPDWKFIEEYVKSLPYGDKI